MPVSGVRSAAIVARLAPIAAAMDCVCPYEIGREEMSGLTSD